MSTKNKTQKAEIKEIDSKTKKLAPKQNSSENIDSDKNGHFWNTRQPEKEEKNDEEEKGGNKLSTKQVYYLWIGAGYIFSLIFLRRKWFKDYDTAMAAMWLMELYYFVAIVLYTIKDRKKSPMKQIVLMWLFYLIMAFITLLVADYNLHTLA